MAFLIDVIPYYLAATSSLMLIAQLHIKNSVIVIFSDSYGFNCSTNKI